MFPIFKNLKKKNLSKIQLTRSMWSSISRGASRFGVAGTSGGFIAYKFFDTYTKHDEEITKCKLSHDREVLKIEFDHKHEMAKIDHKHELAIMAKKAEMDQRKLSHIEHLSKSNEKYEGSIGVEKFFGGNALKETEKSDLEIAKFLHDNIVMEAGSSNSTKSYCCLEEFLDMSFFYTVYAAFMFTFLFILIFFSHKDHLRNGFFLFKIGHG